MVKRKMRKVKRALLVQGYQCPLCKEVYPTEEQALTCREIDSVDSLSKRFAVQRRKNNEEKYLIPIPMPSK
jgi:ssDNA-binding Zn-finger/Zn-ribbon topoisomerase 1